MTDKTMEKFAKELAKRECPVRCKAPCISCLDDYRNFLQKFAAALNEGDGK